MVAEQSRTVISSAKHAPCAVFSIDAQPFPVLSPARPRTERRIYYFIRVSKLCKTLTWPKTAFDETTDFFIFSGFNRILKAPFLHLSPDCAPARLASCGTRVGDGELDTITRKDVVDCPCSGPLIQRRGELLATFGNACNQKLCTKLGCLFICRC